MNTSDSSGWAAQNRRNTQRLGFWTGAWLISMAVSVFGPTLFWGQATLPTVVAIAVNIGAGIGMIIAGIRHLNGLDELQRKIQLDATALALNVGLVGGLAYSAMDISNLISFDAEIAHMVFLIGLTYLAGLFYGRRKYQ